MRERDFLGEPCLPNDESKSAPANRKNFLFKDDACCYSRHGNDETEHVECLINDWIDEGPMSFVWHKGTYCQAYLTKSDLACRKKKHNT